MLNIFRTGWGRCLSLMNYGQEWREHRRMFQQYFRPMALFQYHSRMTKEVYHLLQLLLDTPDAFQKHIRQ